MANDTRASYTDTFGHAFDTKGRITVPSDWRAESYEARLFVLPSSEKCVRVYPESWLGRLQEQVAALKDADPMRGKLKDLASLAQGTTWDQQGRIMVKEKLREGAGLKKESVLVGRLDHFEIWDKTAWEAKQTAPTTVEEALSAMGL
jgi:MraZ protein